jgi:hypothetical protein
MTDQSVTFIKSRFVPIIMSLKSSSVNTDVALAALPIDTIYGIFQIGGASWYVTSHLQDSQKLIWQYQDRVRGEYL